MKKHITIKVVKVWDKNVLKITEQTHIGKDFGITGNCFQAPGGFQLVSESCPEYSSSMRLYVKGSDSSKNDNTVLVCANVLEKIKAAVQEYNKYFSDIPETGNPHEELFPVETIE